MTTRWTDPDLDELSKKAPGAWGRSFLGMRPMFAGVATPLLAGLLTAVGAVGLSSAAPPEQQGPVFVPAPPPRPPVWRGGPVINPRQLPPLPFGPRVPGARPVVPRVAAIDPRMVVPARPGIDEAMIHQARPDIDPAMITPPFRTIETAPAAPAAPALPAVPPAPPTPGIKVPAQTIPGR